ncbi:MAG: hypothetical protein CMJ84_04450 [Planctomycetes bacterium]|nr:hypothetical protein [Planctomycetota bacterium]MDP6408510.1 hypothetical protein [Planctomycetota bacterium]
MRLAPLLLLAGLPSCLQVSERSPVDLAHAQPTHCRARRAWEVVSAGAVVGVVVEFVEPRQASRRFFSVRNAHHQELGMVDALGRAWRFRPHGADAECLGSGPLLSSTVRVLAIEGPCLLFEVPLEALEAEATPKTAAPPRAHGERD